MLTLNQADVYEYQISRLWLQIDYLSIKILQKTQYTQFISWVSGDLLFGDLCYAFHLLFCSVKIHIWLYKTQN